MARAGDVQAHLTRAAVEVTVTLTDAFPGSHHVLCLTDMSRGSEKCSCCSPKN